MSDINISGTKWYVDIEYKGNVIRFDGEMCVNGFCAIVNSWSWIKHTGDIDEYELPELIKAVKKYNKKNYFKVYFVNDDGSEYR